MAISPTIPTSFVPKQPLDGSPRRKMQAGDNLFLLISLVVIGASVVTAGAVFGYQKYLESVIKVKEAAIATAQAEINQEEVESYIRLKERFDSAKGVLENHVTLSRFFSTLELKTLKNVRFTEMQLIVADDRTAEVVLTGAARNFNTLAAQSNMIADEKMFKRAIFSDIGLNENGTVGFTLTAVLDQKSVIMQMPSAPVIAPEAPAPVAPAPTSTPAVAPTVPAATTTPAATTSVPRL